MKLESVRVLRNEGDFSKRKEPEVPLHQRAGREGDETRKQNKKQNRDGPMKEKGSDGQRKPGKALWAEEWRFEEFGSHRRTFERQNRPAH